MRPSDPALRLEGFHYAPVGSDWAALRVLAVLADGNALPRDARLRIDGADAADVFPARAYGLERRLLHRGADELLWHASFHLPMSLVQSPAALFALLAADGLELTLPAPGLRPFTRQTLAISGYRVTRHDSRVRVGAARQLAALATAVAVTATSFPAAALADASSATTTPPAVAPAATTSTTAATASSDSTASTTSTDAASTTPAPTVPAAPTAPTASTTPATPTAPAASTTAATAAPTVAATATGGRLVDTTPTAGRTGATGTRRGTQATRLFAAPSHAAGDRTTAASACNTRDAATAYAAHVGPTTVHCPAPAHRTTSSATGPAQGLPQGATLRIGPGTNPSPPTAAPGSTISLSTPVSSTHPARHHIHRGTAHRNGGAPVLTPVSSAPAAPSTTAVNPVAALSPDAPGFLAPTAWTGTVNPDPALTGAVENLSGLLTDGNRPPSFLIPIYMEAGRRYDIPWEILAAINAVETDYGHNLNTSSAGAVGWMQFEPSTWKRYGRAVDGHSVANPFDPRDAIFAAARYLAAAGAGQDVARAIYAYNHAGWYVDEVLTRARAIASHAQFEHASLRRGSFSVEFATGLRHRPTVSYQSGVLSHYDRLIAAANMVSAANFPYLWGGGHEEPARFGPFDCSGSVSYVMQQAGYKVPTSVSGNIGSWKFPTGPGRVTIFYNPTHTFMRIGNRFFGTSGFARPGGGAGWFSVDKLPAGYLDNFAEVHVPGLGTNSFAPGSLPPLPVRHHHRSGSTTGPLNPPLLLSTLGSFPRVS